MDRVGMLLLAVLLISASACPVQGKVARYWIQFYEKRPTSSFTLIFRPRQTEPVKNKGWGWASHYDILHPTGGFAIGYEGGMDFYHSTSDIEMIYTITFSTILEGIWKGSSLNLRGLWRRAADDSKFLPEQELSIVGGQGGLRGARGSVYYKEVQLNPVRMYLITCDVYVDDFLNVMPIIDVDLGSLHENGTELVHDSPEITYDVLKQVAGFPG